MPGDLADNLISAATPGNPLHDLTIDKLIGMGVEVRDELKAEKRKFSKYEAEAKGLLSQISHALKLKGDSLGVNSFSTAEGTAFRSLKESYRVGNWASAFKFMQETGNWQMLEKRVGKLATKEIHKATGAVPPGVEYIAEEEFVIRRPNEKSKGDSDE